MVPIAAAPRLVQFDLVRFVLAELQDQALARPTRETGPARDAPDTQRHRNRQKLGSPVEIDSKHLDWRRRWWRRRIFKRMRMNSNQSSIALAQIVCQIIS